VDTDELEEDLEREHSQHEMLSDLDDG
jgi:hypothetical protein